VPAVRRLLTRRWRVAAIQQDSDEYLRVPAANAQRRSIRRRAIAWVDRTAREQGVPVKTEQARAVERVAAIFADARQKRLQA